MSTIEMPETGSATKNQRPQSSGGSIACSAIRFWGDEIGDDCPPMLAASAIASCAARGGSRLEQELNDNRVGKEVLTTRQGPKDAFGGRVRKIGYDKRGLSACEKWVKPRGLWTHLHEREAESWGGNI